jgi:hypothetical protein
MDNIDSKVNISLIMLCLIQGIYTVEDFMLVGTLLNVLCDTTNNNNNYYYYYY